MRRLSVVLVAAVMLSLCASSYGYFLIYNVSTTVKGVDTDSGKAISAPLKGFLVLNMNDSGQSVDAALVIYSSKLKKYAVLDLTGNEFLGKTDAQSAYDYLFVYLEGEDKFDFVGQLIGKVKAKDVGLGAENKKNVASSAKGVVCVWSDMLGDSSFDITGTANISMTLNNTYTKAVNDPTEPWTMDEIVNGKDLGEDGVVGIKPLLNDKEMANVTPAATPAPPL